MVYIVPKKDQVGDKYIGITIPNTNGMQIFLHRTLEKENILEKCSILMLYKLAEVLDLQCSTVDEFCEAIKHAIQFEE